MKDFIKLAFMAVIVLMVYVFRNDIIFFIYDKIIYKNNVLSYNEYYINSDYEYFKNIDTESVTNHQELLNMLYTVVNSGDSRYEFYCKYNGCTDDIKKILDDKEFLPIINNFVHPYNSFESINVDITALDRITLSIKKVYSDDEIEYINNYIDDFIRNNISDNMSDFDKIRKFHDYMVNTYEYDEAKSNKSYSAYNLIIKGKAICGGYSDLMSIYLNRIGIKNYRVSSETHIWNLVNLGDKWYHLDVTWDDPVASDGKPHLLHNFFMISTNELYRLDTVEHNFDTNIFIEAK